MAGTARHLSEAFVRRKPPAQRSMHDAYNLPSQQEHTKENPYVLPPEVNVSLMRLDLGLEGDYLLMDNVVPDLLKKEAKHHGATFDYDNFQNVVDAVADDKAHALVAKVQYNGGRQIIAGVVILLPSVRSTFNVKTNSFDKFHALYIEDTFIDADKSAEFRSATKSNSRPKGIGLGEFIHHELFRQSINHDHSNMFEGKIAAAYLAECGQQNAAMKCIYHKFDNERVCDPNMHIVRFDTLPVFTPSIDTTISVYSLAYETQVSGGKSIADYLFTTNWTSKNGRQHIQMDVMNSISTFVGGERVYRVFINDSGNLPVQDDLVTVYADSIVAAANEVCKGGWARPGDKPDSVIPHMYFHVPPCKDKTKTAARINALKELGGYERILGICPMVPVIMDYQKMPDAVFYDGRVPPTKFELYSEHAKPPYRTKQGFNRSSNQLINSRS